MIGLTFDQKVLLEQVRHLEESDSISDKSEDTFKPATSDFETNLLSRARHLIGDHRLSETLERTPKLIRMTLSAACLVAIILGAIAALSAVSTSGTINIYWLLLVLVGFNWLSIALWTLGMTVKASQLTGGILPRISTWGAQLINRQQSAQASSGAAWLRCHFAGKVGRWRYSQLTQQLWLLYLGAGLLALLLALMAKQFDFFWGTTLLTDSNFTALTRTLGYPLQAIGLDTPSDQMVLETRIGSGAPLTAEHRSHWAQLLLGTLLLWGLLPRLLLWTLSSLMLRLSRNAFSLDYYLPYYVQLRQVLKPDHGPGEIVDPDTAPSKTASDSTLTAERSDAVALAGIPESALWVAIELKPSSRWPTRSQAAPPGTLEVIDRQSLEQATQHIEEHRTSSLAIAVSGDRAPDRGLERTIMALADAVGNVWLTLLRNEDEKLIANERLEAWFRLAQRCGIPADNVVSATEGAQ